MHASPRNYISPHFLRRPFCSDTPSAKGHSNAKEAPHNQTVSATREWNSTEQAQRDTRHGSPEGGSCTRGQRSIASARLRAATRRTETAVGRLRAAELIMRSMRVSSVHWGDPRPCRGCWQRLSNASALYPSACFEPLPFGPACGARRPDQGGIAKRPGPTVSNA